MVPWGSLGGMSRSVARTSHRDRVAGTGRGGVKPSPGIGDGGLVIEDLHALRPKASADWSG